MDRCTGLSQLIRHHFKTSEAKKKKKLKTLTLLQHLYRIFLRLFSSTKQNECDENADCSSFNSPLVSLTWNKLANQRVSPVKNNNNHQRVRSSSPPLKRQRACNENTDQLLNVRMCALRSGNRCLLPFPLRSFSRCLQSGAHTTAMTSPRWRGSLRRDISHWLDRSDATVNKFMN